MRVLAVCFSLQLLCGPLYTVLYSGSIGSFVLVVKANTRERMGCWQVKLSSNIPHGGGFNKILYWTKACTSTAERAHTVTCAASTHMLTRTTWGRFFHRWSLHDLIFVKHCPGSQIAARHVVTIHTAAITYMELVSTLGGDITLCDGLMWTHGCRLDGDY